MSNPKILKHEANKQRVRVIEQALTEAGIHALVYTNCLGDAPNFRQVISLRPWGHFFLLRERKVIARLVGSPCGKMGCDFD